MNMKNKIKYLGILLVGLAVTSCHETGKTTEVKLDSKFNTIIVEDCEYIYNTLIGMRSLVHKGNCKSEIHKCKCN